MGIDVLDGSEAPPAPAAPSCRRHTGAPQARLDPPPRTPFAPQARLDPPVRRGPARRADRRAGGWALALLARTKVRAPARPRARHPAPSAPLLCALQVPGPVQALAQRQRRARRRQAAGRRLKPAPVLRGATSTSSTRSPTGRAGRGRGLEVRPRAPHRPLCVRYDPCHPLHRSRTARCPHLPPDPLSPHGRLTPLPHPFAQVLARGPLTSRRLGGGAARRRSGGGLTRPGRPDDPAARRRHRGGAGARRAVAEAVVPPPLERGCGPNIQFMRRACRVLVFLFAS